MAQKKTSSGRKVVVVSRAPNSSWARIMYGELVSCDLESGVATLKGARQCNYYSAATRGEAGLAAIGPQRDSKVSPLLDGEVSLTGVGLVMDATPVAQATWEAFT